jgi:hypothetical protein
VTVTESIYLRRAHGRLSLTFWFGSLFAEQIRAAQESFPFLELIGHLTYTAYRRPNVSLPTRNGWQRASFGLFFPTQQARKNRLAAVMSLFRLLAMEAEVGIEPAYTALQAAA